MATCPKCGAEYAYIGMNTIECINSGCEAYSETLKEEVDSTRITPLLPPAPSRKHSTASMHQKISLSPDDDFADATYWAELMFNSD